MKHGEFLLIYGLTLLLFELSGCDAIVNERLDPEKSTVSSALLTRIGLCNDGSVVSISEDKVIRTSQPLSRMEVLATYKSKHYAPLVSPANDQLVTFRYEKGTGYIHLSTLPQKVEREFRLGMSTAIPVAFSSDGGSLLLLKYSSNAIGQAIGQKPVVLHFTSGAIDEIGDDAVVDSSGTHLLILQKDALWKSLLGNPGAKKRITSGLNPIAISRDGRQAVVASNYQELQILDLDSGGRRPLAHGYFALFLASGKSIAVVSENNKIAIVRLDENTEQVLTNWKNHNSIPIQSNNGRYFAFERSEDELGMSKTTFVYDEEIGGFVK